MLGSRGLDFDFANLGTHSYVSSTCIPNFIKIDLQKLWDFKVLYVTECKTLRSIYSISLVFHNACFEG